jgi:hypothetical protein
LPRRKASHEARPITRKPVWKSWASETSKEEWVGTGFDVGRGAWTKWEVFRLWAALFRRVEGMRRVDALILLIRSHAWEFVDSRELHELLWTLTYYSVLINSDVLGGEFTATEARAAIRKICRALVGPGGKLRTKTNDDYEEQLATDQKKEKEVAALFVLDCDREANRRKGDDITLQDVIKERLKAGNHPFWLPFPFPDEVSGEWKKKATFGTPAVKALALDREYRSLVRQKNPRSKIRSALGLRKRRNKDRTRIPPTR